MGHYEVTSGFIQNTLIELKFYMNDLHVNSNMLKYFTGQLKSLWGHYEVTSGFIKHAPMELKFDMNDP